MSAAPENDYVVVRSEPAARRAELLALWRGTLSESASRAGKFDWFYLQGPEGAPLLLELRCGVAGPMVGAAAAGWRRMVWSGRPVRAGLLVDFTVSAAHRSLYPALLLQREMQRLGEAQAALLYGFPNPRATAVFARAGYRRIGDLQRYAGVLRVAAFLPRWLPRWLAIPLGAAVDAARRMRLGLLRDRRWRLAWASEPWEHIDRVWSDAPPASGPVAVRDADFVRWRCGQCPGGPMKFYIACDAATGRPLAWLACESSDNVLHVRDWWTVDGSTRLLTGLLRGLRSEVHEASVRSLSVEYFGAPAVREAVLAAGLRPRGARPVFATLFASQSGDAPPGWHLTAADEDE